MVATDLARMIFESVEQHQVQTQSVSQSAYGSGFKRTKAGLPSLGPERIPAAAAAAAAAAV